MFQSCSLVILALTQKCNMNCKYCFLGDKTSLPNTEMSFKTFQKIVDKIVQDFYRYKNMKPFGILFHGGEPTLLSIEKLEKMLEYGTEIFSKNNIPIDFSIQTNGIKLTEEYINLFKKYHVSIGVSVDGILNNLRESRINPEKILQNIETAQKQGVKPGILSVVTKQNITTIRSEIRKYPQLRSLKFIKEEDINSEEDYSPKAEDYFNEILKKDFEDFLLNKIGSVAGVERLLVKHLITELAYCKSSCQSTCQFKFCGGAVNLISFLPDGTLRFCDRYRGDETFFNGNIKKIDEYDFLDLKQYKKLIEFISFFTPMYEKRGCDRCIYSEICQFPCPTINYKKYKQPEIPLDTCKLTKLVNEYVKKNLFRLLEYFFQFRNGVIETHEHIPVFLKKDSYKPFKLKIQDKKIIIFK